MAHLKQLPFVRRAQLDDQSAINQTDSQALTLTTPQGQYRAFLNWSPSTMTLELRRQLKYRTHIEASTFDNRKVDLEGDDYFPNDCS